MGQLRAEKRPDKNGKLVTRHVRDGAREGQAQRPVPAPPVAAAPKPAFDSAVALATIRDLPGGWWRRADALARAYADLRISDATLAAVLDVASADARSRDLLTEYLEDALIPSRDESDACIHAAVRSVPMQTVLHSHWYTMRGAAVRDLHHAGRHSGLTDFSGAPDESHVSLFKAHLFAARVGLHPEAYPLKHDYHLSMEALRQRIDDIEACLPPLAANLPKRNRDRDMADDPSTGLTWEDVRTALDAVQSSGIDPEELVTFMDARGIDDLDEAIALMLQSTAPLREGVL